MSQPTMDPELLDGMLDYVQKTSITIKRAVDENAVYQEIQKKAAALRPEVLEVGRRSGCFPPDQIKEAEALLADHASTLMLLKQSMELHEKKAAAGKTELGDAADKNTEKAAGDTTGTGSGDYNSLVDPVVGNKSPNGKKASDLAFERRLRD